jgi:hypothetical protein
VDRLSTARNFLARGWTPVPVKHGEKKPVGEGWQQRRVIEADLPRLFTGDGNLGLLTGKLSGGLVDIDLDCAEAVALADGLLPPTPMRSGRTTRRSSHRWYLALNGIPASRAFTDIDKSMLVELRTDGHQTLVQPSIHPDGDAYTWDGELNPLQVAGAELTRVVSQLAAAVVLCRHWPTRPGSRHQIANALAGMLLKAGWTDDNVSGFILAVANAAGDEEARDRARDAIATAQSIERGKNVTGAPTLASLLDPKVVDKIREWLGLTPLTALTASTAYAESPEIPWPAPMADAAFHGIAGKVVALLDPHTESDRAAVLVQFLAAAGNCVGRGPHYLVEANQHHLNLFVAIVGATSKGRKGTSWGQIHRLLAPLDPAWALNRIVNGLSSGEGLIWNVRDPIMGRHPVKVKGRIVEFQEIVADKGVEDKRLLVLESELASVLRVIAREGNTLSPTIRSAWETGRLQTLTKTNPATATDAFISIVGHISRDELVRELDRTEVANGFANRFLWVAAQRSKLLPDGGSLADTDLFFLQEELKSVLSVARGRGQIVRDAEAKSLWHEVYGPLSNGKPGLFGAVVSRAEAQVTRLATLYALLDKSSVIRCVHLEAALAVWRYSEESAKFIFGDALGDPIADAIHKALRDSPQGLTRNEIRELFGRNQSSGRIGRALRSLQESGLARFELEPTDGRSAERWILGKGYAVDAVNAISQPVDDPYRVNRVNGVTDPPADPRSESAPPDGLDDDEVAL